jgi:5-methylcytosine-specific restriction endonuclease McrA
LIPLYNTKQENSVRKIDPELKRERRRVASARWRAANLEKARASEAKWRAANPEKARAVVENYKIANPEKVRARQAKWYVANRETVLAKGALYRANTPEKQKLRSMVSRARKLNALVHLTETERAAIAEIYRQRDLMTKLTGEQYHVDHVISLAKGGKHHPNNLQLLTAVENLKKGVR